MWIIRAQTRSVTSDPTSVAEKYLVAVDVNEQRWEPEKSPNTGDGSGLRGRYDESESPLSSRRQARLRRPAFV